MRKLYPMQTRINNDPTKTEYTAYQVKRDDQDRVLLSTSFQHIDVKDQHEMLRIIAEEMTQDPLLSDYLLGKDTRLTSITFKGFKENTSVFIWLNYN